MSERSQSQFRSFLVARAQEHRLCQREDLQTCCQTLAHVVGENVAPDEGTAEPCESLGLPSRSRRSERNSEEPADGHDDLLETLSRTGPQTAGKNFVETGRIYRTPGAQTGRARRENGRNSSADGVDDDVTN